MRENFRAEVRQIAGAVASETLMRYADALARSPYAQQTMDETARRVATDVARAIAGERVAHAEEIVRSAGAAAESTATRTAQQVAERTASNLSAATAAKVLQEARETVETTLGSERTRFSETLEKERRQLGDTLETERNRLDETLGRQRTELDETVGKGRTELDETLGRGRTELDGILGRGRTELDELLGKGRDELTEALEKQRRQLKKAQEDLKKAETDLKRTVGRFAQEETARAVAAKVAESVPPVIEIRIGAATEPGRVTGHTHAVLPDVLLTLGAGCHVLLVGPAGTGKSMMAQQAAAAFKQDFHALSLGPTTPMSKIFGYYDAHGNYHDTPFRRAFEDGGLMLLDELDSGHPGLLAELNQALSIRSCAFADGMVAAHPDFRLIATANTYGTGGDRQYVGRQALDAATLDRFVVVDVPVDEDLEERLALAHAPGHAKETRRVVKEVRRLRATAAEKRLPVMFSPRASIDAARLLQAGASVQQAIRWRVVRGMSQAHRSALGLSEGGAK